MRSSTLRAYLELLRLPNVFTAVADVMMGAWFVTASAVRPGLPLLRPGVMLLLVGASCCLYLSGMVLNDYFDRDKDARERPARPIPSRRVPESAAQWFGSELLILGVAMAWAASYLIGSARPGVIALGLAAAVILYDAYLKQTLCGPLAMGACRLLNVLLGMSVVTTAWEPAGFVVAGGLALYIVGVTAFARTEATISQRAPLVVGTLIIVAGMVTLAWFPNMTPTRVDRQMGTWYLFWAVLVLQTAWRCLRAIADPRASNVQIAVKQCLLTLIVLDATVVFAVQGIWPALCVIALLIPTMILGRWIYST